MIRPDVDARTRAPHRTPASLPGVRRAPSSTVARSVSRVDNVEHVYLKRLDAGTYDIEISRTDALSELWDFALAWRIHGAPDGFGGDAAARAESVSRAAAR